MFRIHSGLTFLAGKAIKSYKTTTLSSILGTDSSGRYLPVENPDVATSPVQHPVPRRIWKILSCGAALFFLLALVAHLRDSTWRNLTSSLSREAITKEEYIHAVLKDPIEGLFDPEPVRKKCNETSFQDGLIWHCGAINGGIGNVGNMLINCVRYAIEAGATTLILPPVSIRSETNLAHLGAGSSDISYLYDSAFFLATWPTVCPQMRAELSESTVANLPSDERSVDIIPNRIKGLERGRLIDNDSRWREMFDSWLAEKVPASQPLSTETPFRVNQRAALCQWNVENEQPGFVPSFARLFRFPEHIRRLSASVLWNLEKKLDRPIVSDSTLFSPDGRPSSMVNSLEEHRFVPGGFFGVHLRVEEDAAKAGWTGYESQAPFYITEAEQHNLTTIYLATGSAKDRERFRKDAAEKALSVISKEELLEEEELSQLQSLSWDQQAIVDYDVLLYSTFFTGFSRSTFSWTITVRRSILPEAGTFTLTFGEDVKYRDNLSAVVGRFDGFTTAGTWP